MIQDILNKAGKAIIFIGEDVQVQSENYLC